MLTLQPARIERDASASVLSLACSAQLDEVRHAELFAHLALRDDAPLRATLREYVAPVFDGLFAALFGPPESSPEEPFDADAAHPARGHGYLSLTALRALFIDTVGVVWRPGLDALGLDARSLARRYRWGMVRGGAR